MTVPKPAAGGDVRPAWLPAGTSVVDHVREAARRAGPPSELDDPETDWDWDGGNLVAEARRVGCIPEEEMQRAVRSLGEDKPLWWLELCAASGRPTPIALYPAVAVAAASGALGERARDLYEDMAAKGLIEKTAATRPSQRRDTAPAATAPADQPDTGAAASWRRVGDKTVEVTLTVVTTRRYRAKGQALDRLLVAAVTTARLGEAQRMAASSDAAEGVSVTTGAGGCREATRGDGAATAVAERVGAKTAAVTLAVTATRRYRADDTEALRICAAAEVLGGLRGRAKMLPDHTPQKAGPGQHQSHPG